MTRKCRLTFLTVLFFSIYTSAVNAAATQPTWVLAAQKFSLTGQSTQGLSEGLAATMPSLILEKISSGLYRSIGFDEELDRKLYKLKNERNSLFLQLSSEVKKRDSLVLGNYTQTELDRKLTEQNKKVNEIKTKLKENLEQQKEQTFLLYEEYIDPVFEKVTLYKDNISTFFDSTNEKEILAAGIRCLLTGTITCYQEYMAVSVQASVYPGKRNIAYITEIGSMDELDYIASNIARQLSPAIANSLPSAIKINVLPQAAQKSLNVYIDDVLYTNIEDQITIDSGIHSIQFTAQDYRNCGTSYYFEGNKVYDIQVELEPTVSKVIFIQPAKPVEGDFLANGVGAQTLSDGNGKIIINGKNVLGEFITPDGSSAFFYINEKNLNNQFLYTAKIKPLKHGDYIEKRRKEMYLSYSILVTSLIPTIVTKGIVKNYKTVLTGMSAVQTVNDYDESVKRANAWVTSANIFTGVSIACGVWFAVELFLYFRAADSVLPVSTKMTFDYIPPEDPPQEDALPEEALPEEAPPEEQAVLIEE